MATHSLSTPGLSQALAVHVSEQLGPGVTIETGTEARLDPAVARFARRLGLVGQNQSRGEFVAQFAKAFAGRVSSNAPLGADERALALRFGAGLSALAAEGSATDEFRGFRRAFEAAEGPEVMDRLKASFSNDPVVLIGGQALTGKSSRAKILAGRVEGGAVLSGGALIRARAKEAGIPVAEMAKAVDFDTQVDLATCRAVGSAAFRDESGGEQRTAVAEGRLAGPLGGLLRNLGRENLFSVYLVCSPRERALRYLDREVSPAARSEVLEHLKISDDASMEEFLVAVGEIDPNCLSADVRAALAKAGDDMKAEAARDETDRQRYLKLYAVDFLERSSYDLVVDTTNLSPEQVDAAIQHALPRHFPQKR